MKAVSAAAAPAWTRQEMSSERRNHRSLSCRSGWTAGNSGARRTAPTRAYQAARRTFTSAAWRPTRLISAAMRASFQSL